MIGAVFKYKPASQAPPAMSIFDPCMPVDIYGEKKGQPLTPSIRHAKKQRFLPPCTRQLFES